MRVLNSVQAMKEGLAQLMALNEDYYLIGEGVPDPKACFGVTKGLRKLFPGRVFDMPISEAGGTGMVIGSAIAGLRPIMIHMRNDFLLYAMDQIVNNAAKWHTMFGGQASVPAVIMAFVGRGWGAGHQHSQNLEAMFAGVPGLKVVCPSTAYNSKGLLMAAAKDDNPVIFLSHRWTHHLESEFEEVDPCDVRLGEARVARKGRDITLVAWGHMVTECLKAAEFLAKEGVEAEIIDLQTIQPLDIETIRWSMGNTQKLLVVQDAVGFCGIGAEIIAQVAEKGHGYSGQLQRITPGFFSPPSSHGLSNLYYPNVKTIANKAAEMCGHYLAQLPLLEYLLSIKQDIPNKDYKGPF